MTVPVDIEVVDVEPQDSFDKWDQVNECSIDVKSGASSSQDAQTTFQMLRRSGRTGHVPGENLLRQARCAERRRS